MKKTIAFLIALVLFLGTAGGLHLLVKENPRFDPHTFGAWINQNKIFAGKLIKENLDENSIVVMGSSEFRHGRDMESHPLNMFEGNTMNMMMIGEGYYQSLFHAVELGAIEDGIQNKKVVLILSPQWFHKAGVLPSAYASRFPEMNFIAMLQDEKISKETKQYILDRSKKLLEGDPTTLKRVKKYERIFLAGKGTAKEKKFVERYQAFYKEKTKISLFVFSKLAGIKKEDHKKVLKDEEPNWEKCMRWAESAGKKEAGENPFYIANKLYKRQIRPILKESKNKSSKSSYAVSPEYKDLECFLQICKETGIEPMLVMTPVNGYWYDYTGFPKEGRDKYYENIRKIAADYDAELADLSEEEYTKYFFLDRVHFGWKGWVYVNEEIYRYAREGKAI